jgi:predicted LPLAT superfamily acyltransferase
VIIRNTSSAATYYVRVYGYNGANNASQCYLLRINTKNSAWREAEWQVNNEVVVFPNPAMDKVHIQFSSPKSEDVTIRLADITGRIVQSLTMTTEAGLNTAALEVMQLPKGIYLLELVNTEGRTVKRFVKE